MENCQGFIQNLLQAFLQVYLKKLLQSHKDPDLLWLCAPFNVIKKLGMVVPTPAIPALWKPRQEDCQFEAIFNDYTVSSGPV